MNPSVLPAPGAVRPDGSSQRPLPPGLPVALGSIHRRICDLVEHLPSAPPSTLAAMALNRWLLHRLPDDARAALQGRVVALHVSDFGMRVRLRLEPAGFVAAADRGGSDLCIRATAGGYLRLARGDEDPDRLFFERELVMEGDTELGLVLKNSLDAIGPLWERRGS
ncbi:MAG TPA: SCP2 sterol-binding domain-containing protein [Burkholderiaceae bacterium]|nr:SCP2 sterol-binding domain-containing protein [Burkholderiaceae bacterium]